MVRRANRILTTTAAILLLLGTVAHGADESTAATSAARSSEPGAQSAPAVVEVVTSSYLVRLSSRGGLPESWQITDRDVIGEDTSLHLVDPEIGTDASSLAVVLPGRGFGANTAVYGVARQEAADAITVKFVSPVFGDGLQITRRYEIPRQGFVSRVVVTLTNTSSAELVIDEEGRGPGLILGPGLDRPPTPEKGIGGGLYAYVRPVVRLRDEARLTVLEPEPEETAQAGTALWGGVNTRYFLAALVPERPAAGDQPLLQARATLPRPTLDAGDGGADLSVYYPTLTLFQPGLRLLPGDSATIAYRFYFGPKQRSLLRQDDLALDDVLFLGLWNWMRWLCFVLMSLLNVIHSVIGSWGLSIICLAILVRIITFPIAQVGLKQQALMSRQQATLKAKLAEINEQWADDPTRKSQESWNVYKEHGVGPLSATKGCLWLVVQIPIFIALFNLLGQSFALRGASFLWIHDLAQPDRLFPLGIDLPFFGAHFNLLPFIMAGTQVFVTNVSGSPDADPGERSRQKKFMFGMALLFLVLFYSFPSGLVLYWMMSNLGQLLQQKMVEMSSRAGGGG